eukprot:1142755-Alexandrium_andersonii.AAC.1
MIRRQKGNKKAKLAAKGAETRHLVPFGAYLADQFHSHCNNPTTLAIKSLMQELHTFYQLMSYDDYDAEASAEACRRACLQFVALSKATDLPAWKCKPKLHLWQEMAEFLCQRLGNPRDFW